MSAREDTRPPVRSPFVLACLTPHGGEIVPEVAGQDVLRMAKTRRSMEHIGVAMTAAQPEVIIVLTPHGVRVAGQFAISDCERLAGVLDEGTGRTMAMERLVHRRLAQAIAAAAADRSLPAALVNYATSEGPLSFLPLDWGAIVPLRFLPETPIVSITPPRTLPATALLRFGAAMATAVRAAGLRVGLVASCDWSHTHDAHGPYGFHQAAAALDSAVVARVQANELERIAEFDPEFIEHAKPDGIWQSLVLAGAMPASDRQVQFLSYEVPTYFGLLTALVYPAS